MAMMTAEEAAEWGKTLSFEKVWAAFMETDQKMAETDRKMAETAEQIRETDKKIADLKAVVERVSNNVGGLNRSVGELVETLIAARLWEKFPGYNLTRAYQRIPVYNEKNERKTDIDILLADTALCMVVEVKRELDRMPDVDAHLKRMELIRQYPPPLIAAGAQLLGAMAGGIVDPEVKDYAYRSGFFVLELTGESVHLVQPPAGFEPRRW